MVKKKTVGVDARSLFSSSPPIIIAAFVCVTAFMAVGCDPHKILTNSSNAGIKSFYLPGIDIHADIDRDRGEITFAVPYDADLKNITPQIEFEGAKLEPENGAPQNFHAQVKYIVYDTNGSQIPYFVIPAFSNNPAVMTSFELKDTALNKMYSGVLSLKPGVEGVVTVAVPRGTAMSSLIPVIAVAEDYKLEREGRTFMQDAETKIYTGDTPEDFSGEDPLTYTVLNDKFKRIYSVKIEYSDIGEKYIWHFAIPGQTTSKIDQETGQIEVRLPASMMENGAKTADEVLRALKPDIAFRGLKMQPENRAEQDFSGGKKVEYKVYAELGGGAEDSAPEVYSVTVLISPAGEENIVDGLGDLANIELTSVGGKRALTLDFNKDRTEYVLATKTDPAAADKLRIRVTPQSTNSVITYKELGMTLNPAQTLETSSLARKTQSTITLRVEGQVEGMEKSIVKEYVIKVYRGNNSANLTTLGLAPVESNKVFDWQFYPVSLTPNKGGDFTYFSKQIDWNNRMRFNPTLEDADATMLVKFDTWNNYKVTPDNRNNVYNAMMIPLKNTPNYLTTGKDMQPRDLPAENKITITVTSEDKEVQQVYTVNKYAWINPAHQNGKIPHAGGGVVTYVGNDEIHIFKTRPEDVKTQLRDTFYFPFDDKRPPHIRILLLGGGGAGGACFKHTGGWWSNGGGGGGGQVTVAETHPITKNSYEVVVGAGGNQKNNYYTASSNATNGDSGGASTFDVLTAQGGGGGYACNSKNSSKDWDKGGKRNADGTTEGGSGNSDAVTSHQGGGGGAGAGGNGGDGGGNYHGSKGGAGVMNDITGQNRAYGQGGSTTADGSSSTGDGGVSGGNSEDWNNYAWSDSSDTGAYGGNGIVVIRFTRR